MRHPNEQAQDFQKMCKQAERDHESKQLVVLIERVKRQLDNREQAPEVQSPKPRVAAVTAGGLPRTLSRSSFFER